MGEARTSLGIDIGSVSVKLVAIERGRIVDSAYRRFEDGPFRTLAALLDERADRLAGRPVYLGLTGIGGKTAQSILGGRFHGEIAALAAGNYELVPQARTVIEMGGEDSKLLILDGRRKVLKDFAMNAQCAAGTGSFLDQQAGRLDLDIETEFGQLSLKSKNPPRVAGRCSVFAKSDMIHLQQIATPDYDIVAGLCFAVARNFKSAIARGKELPHPIAFEGGVAANPGMVRAFTEVLDLAPDELLVPSEHKVIAAAGAAILAQNDDGFVEVFAPENIDAYLSSRRAPAAAQPSLSFDFPDTKHYAVTRAGRPDDIDNLPVYLGIDVGSLSTNLVLIDKQQRVIARRYLMTQGRPIEAVRRGLKEIGEEVGDRVKVVAVGTTGSGRYLTGDFVGADVVRNEITAQATAAINIDPTVDTIFEIGGQDSKYVSIDDRAVIDFEMNKACAAGTGSFLQEQAEKLHIRIEDEFADRALRAECPVGCGERCTVFMESDLVSHQRQGAEIDDLTAGLAYSIVRNYLTKVVGDRRIGDRIFFQGGVAWNKAVVAAFEAMTGKEITVPPHHDVTGAIGAAILSQEVAKEEGFVTRFQGFDLHKRQYKLESFTCEDCSNQCEIRRVEVEGQEPFYYGSRCEKYDVGAAPVEERYPDYIKIRQKLLYRRYLTFAKPRRPRGRIGLPRVLHFHEYYPFWLAFFESLGFQVVNSDVSNRAITESSLELFAAETCYPIKLVFGHVANLIEKGVDIVFLPSLIKAADDGDPASSDSYICPYVQTIGSTVRTRFDFASVGVKLISRPIVLSHDVEEIMRQFKAMAADLNLGSREFKRAVAAGRSAYRQYKDALHAEGDRALREIGEDEKVLVTVSRPYNGYDPKLSLELPDKVKQLGLRVIPVDMLRLDDLDDFGYMYWRYGRRILSAAEFIRRHPNLFAVYITSFGCGPDSFISHFFRREMAGKPYLQLELDEHSADAGLITRLEAFVDSLRFHKYKPPVKDFNLNNAEFKPKDRVIYIPNMCDHAYALKAAFERFGLTAEVMDEPDELTLDFGKRFTSGKECFPCQITTGDMIKYIHRDEFDRSRGVFFMPGADGPCRFGLYSQLHRVVLDELGYRDVPILSPNSQNGYSDFGLESTSFRTISWQGVVFIDCLIRALHLIRPYEMETGATERVYQRGLEQLQEVVRTRGDLVGLGIETGKEFAQVKRNAPDRPLVAVVGEIYLRNNRFSNNYLVDKLEALGLEVRLATFGEWPMYTSAEFRRDSFKRRDFKGVVSGQIQIMIQNRQESQIAKAFCKHLPLPHEWPVERVLRAAGEYLPRDCKGEALLSIGKSIEMAHKGAAGVVNAMPFNCMPGTIVSSLAPSVARDLGGIPWLNISYEGLRDSGEDTRLEAFAEQVRAFARNATPAEHSRTS